MEKYYSFTRNGREADLYIFGDITNYPWRDKDRDAYGLVKELQELDADSIKVHINSCGGSVAEGLAIYNTLKNHAAKITTICDGFACSAASVVFMAGTERIMNAASLMMVHNPWTYARGNAEQFRKQADDLDKIAQASINAYMNCVTISEKELRELLDNETWLTAQDCVKKGFATSVLEAKKENGINQSTFDLIRDKLLAKESAEIDQEAFANLVVEKMKKIFETEKVQEEQKAKESSWDYYLNGGK